MNSFIDMLNDCGARFLGFALPMLIQSSLLIALVFLLDLALRRKVRAVVRDALWVLVLVKLVLPPSFAAPTGMASWLPERKATPSPPIAPRRAVMRSADLPFIETPVPPAIPPPRPRLRPTAWLLLVWLAVGLGLMAWLVRRSRLVTRLPRFAARADLPPQQLLEACREQMRIRRRVHLRIVAPAISPAVYGLWRPVILVPQQLADKLSALHLRAVLLHELAHIKRADVLVHYAQTLLQIIYWWHPLLWLANAHIRRVREQAVDEMVMVAMGTEAETYPATLLEVAKLAFQRPLRLLGLVGIVESGSALAQRIKRLLERPVPKSARLGFGGLAFVLLAGALLLPMARAERKPDANATGAAANPPGQLAVVDVEVEFIAIADEGLENLGLGQPSQPGPNSHRVWVLSSQERADLLRRIERESVVLSAPTITTGSGREAQVEINGVEPLKHPQARATASCQITPRLNGKLIDLLVSAKWTESGDVASVFADDLEPSANRQTAGNGPGQVFAINAAGYIDYDVGTAQTLVGDGGTVVLQNPALVGADGKRILVLVSPRVIRQSASAITPNNPGSAGALSSAPSRPRAQSPPAPDNSPSLPARGPIAAKPTAPGEAERAEFSLEFFNAPVDQIFERYSELTSRVILRPVSLTGTITIINYGPLTRTEAIQALDGALALNNIAMIPQGEKFVKAVPLTQAPREGSEMTKPPANSPKSQPADKTATRSEGHEAKRRFGSPSDPDIEIEAIKPSEFQYNAQTGVSVVTNDFVVRFKGAVLTARRAQINTKTGEVLAEGAVTLQRGNQVWRGERLQFNFIQQKIVETNATGVSASTPSARVPVLGDLPLFGRLFRSESIRTGPGREAIEAKLKQIILPEVVFDNVSLPQALQWLSQQAREHDPDGTGVNLLFNPNVIGAAEQTMIDPNTGNLVTLPAAPLDMSSVRVRIFPPLKNIRLGDALEAMVKTADKPIRYSIEEYAVVISQRLPGSIQLETRVFNVDPKAFIQHLQNKFAGAMDSQQLFRAFFTAIGVDVLPPNMVYFNDRRGTLMVRATPEELRRIQEAIDALGSDGSKKSGRNFPTGSSGANQRSAANLEPKNSPGTSLKPAGEIPAASNSKDPTEATKPEPDDSPVSLETRIFRVDPQTFLENLRATFNAATAEDKMDEAVSLIYDSLKNGTAQVKTLPAQQLVRDFFARAGVGAQPPNMVFFNHRTGVLMVRASAQELDLAQRAIEALNRAPAQITIEAKFMELPTDAARKFGFDLPPPGEASNTWVRVLTAAQMRTVLHAAEQHDGVDILTAPKITTLSGRQTQIQVLDVQNVVNGINVEALTPPGVRSTNGVPSRPSVALQRPVGPTLDLMPYVAPNGYTIHLTAMPQVTESLRRDGALGGAKKSGVALDGRKPEAWLPMPIFRKRQMQAAVDVYDAQTLVLANPQVTVIFKQPTDESATNAIPEDLGNRLLVFITPTLIDPAGNPIHTPGNEPFPADKIPPQSSRGYLRQD